MRSGVGVGINGSTVLSALIIVKEKKAMNLEAVWDPIYPSPKSILPIH